MDRQRPLVQEYSRYTPEDFRVWNALFTRQHELLQAYASKTYLAALDKVGFHAGKIPDFGELNTRLRAATGWELAVVAGHVPPADFFMQLASRKFPATCWLRSFAELDYIEEPDMFHDVFGHVPLLMDPQYAAFMQRFGALALTFTGCDAAIDALSRLYWFTIEFGLINEGGSRRAYGAGILSSPGETRHSMGPVPRCAPFDARTIMQTPFRTDIIQDRYFTIGSFDELGPALDAAQAGLEALRDRAVPV